MLLLGEAILITEQEAVDLLEQLERLPPASIRAKLKPEKQHQQERQIIVTGELRQTLRRMNPEPEDDDY